MKFALQAIDPAGDNAICDKLETKQTLFLKGKSAQNRRGQTQKSRLLAAVDFIADDDSLMANSYLE